MPFRLYKAWNEGEEPRWFGIRIEYDEDHWVSTCREVAADGQEMPGSSTIAPRFYGVTAEQAHRRMLDVLEDTYDQVASAVGGMSS